MPQREVHCCREIAAPAEVVWALLREFAFNWHPGIEWMKAEQGGKVRCFKARAEDTIYRERLTYLSDSDRTLRYVHAEGISDIEWYHGTCGVQASAPGCEVTWHAAFCAGEPRLGEVEAGTKSTLEGALQALVDIFALRDVRLPGAPTLSLTHTVERSGPLVLFLHGIGGNRENWNRQLAAVAPLAQAAALDLRGYGASALGENQSCVEDYCADIQRVLAHFKRDKVILCGLSYGAWIATSFAMRHPEKLAGLIMSGGCTGMSEASDEERAAFLASRQKPLDEGKTPADFAPAVVKVIAGPNTAESLRCELQDTMAAIPSSTYRDAIWCFAHPEEQFDFAKITCPVLLMTGEHDRLAPPDEIRAVARRITEGSVRFEVIPGAGHVCNLEQPRIYDNHLTQFIKTIQ